MTCHDRTECLERLERLAWISHDLCASGDHRHSVTRQSHIEIGVLNTGVPCAPLKVTRYKDGSKKYEITAYSRKFPFLHLR